MNDIPQTELVTIRWHDTRLEHVYK